MHERVSKINKKSLHNDHAMLPASKKKACGVTLSHIHEENVVVQGSKE